MCHANSHQRARTIQCILRANDIPSTIEEMPRLPGDLRNRAIKLFPIEVPLQFLNEAKEVLRRFGQLIEN
jgi:hypothetical protein